jgi:hypothetical protein
MQRGLCGLACLSRHIHPPTRSPWASDNECQSSGGFRPERIQIVRSLLQSQDGWILASERLAFASKSGADRAFCGVYAYRKLKMLDADPVLRVRPIRPSALDSKTPRKPRNDPYSLRCQILAAVCAMFDNAVVCLAFTHAALSPGL